MSMSERSPTRTPNGIESITKKQENKNGAKKKSSIRLFD